MDNLPFFFLNNPSLSFLLISVHGMAWPAADFRNTSEPDNDIYNDDDYDDDDDDDDDDFDNDDDDFEVFSSSQRTSNTIGTRGGR